MLSDAHRDSSPTADHAKGPEHEEYDYLQARIANGRSRGHYRELREAIHVADLLGREMRCRIELRNLRRDARTQPFASGDREWVNGQASFHESLPEVREDTSDGGYNADPGDYDAVHAEGEEVALFFIDRFIDQCRPEESFGGALARCPGLTHPPAVCLAQRLPR